MSGQPIPLHGTFDTPELHSSISVGWKVYTTWNLKYGLHITNFRNISTYLNKVYTYGHKTCI